MNALERFRPHLILAPSVGLFAALFIAPFAYFFAVSLWGLRDYRIIREFTLKNYEEVGRSYVPMMAYTIEIAVVTALCALVAGFIYAFIIRFKAGRFGSFLLFVALITLFGGYLMKIYAWRTILGLEGIINTLLINSGLVSEPVRWLLYNPPSVIIALTHFLFPFAVLPIVASMRAITDIETEAARDLGASPWRILVDHIIPRCRTGLFAAFVIPFLIACGDWATPILVGGRMMLIGNMISAQFGDYVNWPLGAAMSFSLLAVAGVVIAIFGGLLSLVRPR